ncbi:MAG: copper amine oxidase N-terminal domain-containing protein [Armatimonadetes bacterium]|nr:copper amine oxidase N-terminal domain-containing protein [Armatimonadota bacterium]
MDIQIQGRPTNIETRNENGITYVPVQETAQALGGTASWDNMEKLATITVGQWAAVVRMAESEADVNGTRVVFNGPVFVEENRMWVPVRFFEKAFGYTMDVTADRVNIVNPLAR